MSKQPAQDPIGDLRAAKQGVGDAEDALAQAEMERARAIRAARAAGRTWAEIVAALRITDDPAKLRSAITKAQRWAKQEGPERPRARVRA